MHTIKLEMGDDVYSHIMFLLKNLKSKELRIIEEDESSKKMQTSDEIETQILSNHSATFIQEWKDPIEDEVWK